MSNGGGRVAAVVALVCTLPGCDTTYFGAGAVIGAVPPRPPMATYPNWEYLCMNPRTVEDFNKALNEAGSSGWELVTVFGPAPCFKRPVVPAHAPQGSAADDAPSRTPPEQPSQDSVQAAIRSVLPGAKACVTGAPEASRAELSFASDGTVSKVVVGGWAASNDRSDCVRTALRGANVGPFSQPSFTVGASIKP